MSPNQFLKQIALKPLPRSQRADLTLELTKLLLESTQTETTRKEKKREEWFWHLAQDPEGRAFLTAMTDQCFRSHSSKRAANQLKFLIQKFGVPKFLNPFERLNFDLFFLLGHTFPGFFMPLIRKQLRGEMRHVLLPEEPKKQAEYIKKCQKKNIRINLNHLGEAILGEKEACNRLRTYLEDLANPNIEYISVKISALYSQINLVGFEGSLETIAERLRLLYTVAQKYHFKGPDGTLRAKFVNLDMEEYKDLDLTVTAFTKVLSEKTFLKTHAGIVLQSYLPDAFSVQKKLTEWAQERLEKGGAPIKIRLVKGANLAMEAVDSSLHNWNQAPFEHKVESDANFKRMLEYGCQKNHAQAVHIGVGSHNLFDIAYALILRAENGVEDFVSFEMLEGMAKPMREVVRKLTGSILLYCPEAKEKDFHTAVAYLIRRLDENCGPENFLRNFYNLKPENRVWQHEKEKFLESCHLIDSLDSSPRRLQKMEKHNEPDTDFALEVNREWSDAIFKEWKQKKHPHIPLMIGSEEIISLPENGFDPSNQGNVLYQYSLADVPLIEKALHCAEEGHQKWSSLDFETRSQMLAQAASLFRERRKDLIGAMITDGGKTVQEADPEVSEAIDFIEYYRKNWKEILEIKEISWSAKGTVLVAPPWNFPCAIPVSGIAAALCAGNSVLFKPAPETVLVGWHLVNCFWQAGIPKDVLQFINCKEEPVGNYLIKHPKVASIILTGATETAKKFLKMRPGLDLHAETGGKNAMIVTAMSDRDLAVRDIIASAFGHSGQKCSACSLLILEKEVYDDPQFKNQLLDAASSLKVASAWDKNAKITPLIHPPETHLFRALTQLEEGEEWLLQPNQNHHLSNLWSPGIKWGVKPGSFTHQKELFGPVLGVMRAENLKEAIELANGTPYGLTSGLHSLDEREQTYWRKHIVAGNLYINRGITGAIVGRQPFGGTKASSFGSTKAGGPNYVHQFAIPKQIELPKEKSDLPPNLIPLISALNAFQLTPEQENIWKKSVESYSYWAAILKKHTDSAPIVGQDNFFYHVPIEKCHIRIERESDILPLLQVIAACLICKTPCEVSSNFPLPVLADVVPVHVEDEATLLSRNPSCIRLLEPRSLWLKEHAAERSIPIKDAPVLSSGRFELLNYLREVSLSINYHRYGYLGLHNIR